MAAAWSYPSYYPGTSSTLINTWQDATGMWTQLSTTAANTSMVWLNWAEAFQNGTPIYQLDYNQSAPIRDARTPEQIEEARVARAEMARRNEEARKASAERRKAVEDKARELLVSILDDVQRQEFEQDGFFHVHTRDGERTYRLGTRVHPMRVKGEDGRRFSYCIHPLEHFPADDTVAALKLLLDHDEDAFLEIANATPYR